MVLGARKEMGSVAALRQLLENVCYDTQWKYAVFWRLTQRGLSWEDAYVDNGSTPGFLNPKSKLNVKHGNSMKCLIEMAVACMSHRSYPLEEGILGKVALKGKHHWIYLNEIGCEFHEKVPEEWNQQSTAGIKTILLVPVVPLGVVQLGSLDMVLEDLGEVIRIRNHFGAIKESLGTCISSTPRMDFPDFCAHFKPLVDPSVKIDFINGANTDFYSEESLWQSTLVNFFEDHFEDQPVLDQFLSARHSNISSFPSIGDAPNVEASVNHTAVSWQAVTPSHCRSAPEHKDLDQLSRNELVEEANLIIDHKRLNFPLDCELHKALGLSSKEYNNFIWDNVASKAEECRNLMPYCKMEPQEVYNRSFKDDDALFTKETEVEQLLDAVIAELLNTTDGTKSLKNKCTRSCSNSTSKCSDSCLTRCKTDDSASDLGESVLKSNKRSMSPSDTADFMNPYARASDHGASDHGVNNASSVPGEDVMTGQCNKVTKSAKTGKRRLDIGVDPKPKPRDRQLIQERIKELRELIPNASKCSIDALLDQTIKHMLFLENIPSQAEKLRNSADTKVKKTDSHPLESYIGHQGLSWAYECGRQAEKCPLIVENLEQPGQILVEMRCEGYGFFMEVIQVIRRLKLSIVKGVLDASSDKPWASFIVEAPRGFHRMDILWPLVQLLQHNNLPLAKLF